MLTSAVTTDAMVAAGVPEMYMAAEPRPDLVGGAYLFGDVGTGKTHAACGAIRAYVDSRVKDVEGHEMYLGKRARYVNVPTWFAMLRGTYGKRGESEQEVFDRYAQCGLLVLDDLGKGSRSEWAVERLYMLIDYRWSNRLPTIVTSNYRLSDVAGMLSTDEETMRAIASRLSAMCPRVEMRGEDRRKFHN